jgi:hypothetical protein
MIKKDDWICSIVNNIISVKNMFNFKQQILLNQMRKREKVGVNRDVFIILNGPSLKQQNLSVLKEKSLMFVNRGFKHPLYRELQPEFHVFVDPKMLKGEWSVTWLDEIVEMVPNITFILPVSWAFVDKFQAYIKKGYSFYWISANNPCTCLGVSGSCFQFAIQQQFRRIYFTGFEANGIAQELIQSSSHFYGTNDENLKKTTKDYEIDLFMHSRHFHDLNKFAAKCKKKKISIINLTEGGVLDMFPRKNMKSIIYNIYNNKKSKK